MVRRRELARERVVFFRTREIVVALAYGDN